MGHKKIGLISGSSADPIAGNPRIEGYKKAISDNLHMEVEEKQIVSGNGFGFDDGRDKFIQLMKQYPDLSAIFCVSDEMAIGAISAAYRLGIKIPEDVSIMGYDNLKISEMSVPPLTTTAQPLVKMAEKATEILFKIINKKADDVHSIIMPYQIIERDSVKKIK
jgi:LacI family transcriptional regulator